MTKLQKLTRMLDMLDKLLPEWVEVSEVETVENSVMFLFPDDAMKELLEDTLEFTEDEALRVDRAGTMFMMLSLDRV